MFFNGGAAVEAHHPHALLKGAQVPQLVLDLDGQLPGGGQDHRGDIVALRVGVLHHGNAEGEGLARARGGLGDHVLPLHKGRDGPHLDGGGGDVALLVDGRHEGGGEAHVLVVLYLVYLLAVDLHIANILCIKWDLEVFYHR